jgi:predicted metal-dependent phosphoesterase TrpH
VNERVGAGSWRWLAGRYVVAAVILAGALVPTSSVRDAVTGAVPREVYFQLPASYVLTSPVSRLLDIIGLMSVGQHIVFFLTIVGVAILLGARSGRALISGGVTVLALLIAYALSAAMPRPMAALVVLNPQSVRVDFHSHTNASTDARKSFDAEDNRAWHRAGGFDVAYVSDHRSFSGAEAALARNPRIATDGTTLLSAYEGRYRGLFMIDLGLTRADSAALLDSRRWMRTGNLKSGRRPANVVAIPGPLTDVQRDARDGAPGMAAIEIVDGSPKGFSQHDRDRREIIARADSLNLALVAGSNNHGWGRVVPGWTILNIPNWQNMSPDSLGANIERALRDNPRRAVRVMERARPQPASVAGLILTVPAFAVQIFRELTPPERFAWIFWIWAISFVFHFGSFRRIRGRSTNVLSS